jgi:hypothetical protein
MAIKVPVYQDLLPMFINQPFEPVMVNQLGGPQFETMCDVLAALDLGRMTLEAVPANDQ